MFESGLNTIAMSLESLGILGMTLSLGAIAYYGGRQRQKGQLAGVPLSHLQRTDLQLLEPSEARYQLLLQATPDLYIHLDRRGTYLQVFNPGQVVLFDSSKAKPGNSVFDVLPPHLAHQRMHYVQLALVTRQTQAYEYELEVNGNMRYEEARITACDDDTAVVIVRDISERKRSEQQRKLAELALHQSEARYRAIVEDQTELICRVLPDTTILFVNDAYCRYFGVNREDLIGQSFLPLTYSQDQLEITQILQSLSLTNPTHTSENRVVVNGVVQWMQWVNRALFDASGKLTEIQSVGRDITELKRVEAALQKSNNRFQELAETVQEGFFVYEVATSEYSYLNPTCLQLSGTPTGPLATEQDYAKGMAHWLNNIHPDDRDRIERALQEERQGHNFDQEYRFIRPDGALRWLRSKAFPIQDKTGTVIRIVGKVEDITERKQLELALQESEERFRSAFDHAPIGMSLVSIRGQFLKANTQFCALLGYSEAELLKMTFQSITHPEDLTLELEGFQRMLNSDLSLFQLEKRYITKQGTLIPTLMQTAPIRDRAGQILYFVEHIQDIREQLQVKQMKDEFISVVSHELRTPLTSIHGALGILESGVLKAQPEKLNHMLKIAHSNSHRLVRLVNDILTLERLQSGKVSLVMQACQITDLMQQAMDTVQAIAEQAQVTLSLAPLSLQIWAEPDAIVQTLTNLLSNAIKFSPAGEIVWLKAELGRQEPAGSASQSDYAPRSPDSVIFSVRDRGRGIPDDKLEVIFEQFQQVDVSDSRRKGGTGLGLSICKNIVWQHGGRIWAESCLGKGSTFYFTLPLSQTPYS